MEAIAVQCCIAGGGPAGMMLAYLLARAGVEVLVLEKHADFLRDFRGDTIHPSTLEIMAELGILDEFLKLPHQKAFSLGAQVGGAEFTFAEFSHLPTRCKFVAFIPQWDFLDFIAEQGKRYPSFSLRMCWNVTGLIEESGGVVGVRATTPEGEVTIRADLVVGADGRHSTVRKEAGLETLDLGAPMDVLWFGIPHRPGDPDETMGRFDAGRIFIMINRGDSWQCGFVIPKGTIEGIHAKGLPAFRNEVAALAPFVDDRVEALDDWAKIQLLTVRVDRLRRWYRAGLLCIGDAAHAMSPIGGVGINLAIQDAVAAANVLAAPLRRGRPVGDLLRRIQERRMLPTRITQRVQLAIQDRVVSRIFERKVAIAPPLFLRLAARFPVLQRIPGRFVGMGFRPEHVQSPEAERISG
ncbi:MAG TPA: FAD-dependent oxidoreductase [Alphaproteobacteria bacterium]|nr:FAD-dependent oxidoreductase [Alphaproteobacteria bacterium]